MTTTNPAEFKFAHPVAHPSGPEVHLIPPGDDYAASCGGGKQGDTATLRKEDVTCAWCRDIITEAAYPSACATEDCREGVDGPLPMHLIPLAVRDGLCQECLDEGSPS